LSIDVKKFPEKGRCALNFRLAELRRERGLSQQRLAMDLNMNQNTVSRYENHECEADYSTLIAFADYFGVSLDYLLGRSDER
jgi:transcriptional regulator with XRE-family HTH domain